MSEPVKEITPEQFAKEYQALCDKMGYVVSATPKWVSTNHNSFELIIEVGVSKLKK